MIQSKEPVEIYRETGMENLDRVEEEFYQCQLTGLQQNVKRKQVQNVNPAYRVL